MIRWLATALCCLLGGLGTAQAKEPIVIRFSHVVAPDTPKGKAAEKFKMLAEQRTDGRVVVQIYPNSLLYGDKEELEALQLGAVQMLAPSLAKFGTLGVREFEVFDLPYIFPSREVLHRITNGPIGAALLSKLESRGIVGLAFWDNGFKLMSANRPLRKLEDFQGLKMRIQSSVVLDAQMRALGALPQELSFSTVYQALQAGIVDGTENPPSNMYTQRMHEVQRHATLSNHGYLGYAVIVNKAFWNGLPSDIRYQLDKAMAEATLYANEIAERENQEALEQIRAAGTTIIHEPTEEERQAWRKVLLPIHREMENRVGKDLIDAIYREAEAVQSQES
ncbi:TRAP transporter substrate-binding protein [Telmatospirillum sp. J64-1]|uniref:TRAP transporter substrate-binding protein n=1 Tax=Telmatospirillum sp. J64-1 TaxID=2502183 RepID=UPI00115E0260|nr:TRAP transporter substrate-binding protein [Telmatospirillum sp. J64-1]